MLIPGFANVPASNGSHRIFLLFVLLLIIWDMFSLIMLFKWPLCSLKSFGTSWDHSVNGLSQWEMVLHCNAISHWLSPYLEWFLLQDLRIAVLKWVRVKVCVACMWLVPCALVPGYNVHYPGLDHGDTTLLLVPQYKAAWFCSELERLSLGYYVWFPQYLAQGDTCILYFILNNVHMKNLFHRQHTMDYIRHIRLLYIHILTWIEQVCDTNFINLLRYPCSIKRPHRFSAVLPWRWKKCIPVWIYCLWLSWQHQAQYVLHID